MTKGNEGFSIGIGMIVGLVAGAITGVLFAPQSGEESRQKIKEVLKEYKDSLPEDMEQIKQAGLDSLEKMKLSLEEKIKNVNDHIKAKKLASAKQKETEECDIDYQGE